MQFNQQGEFTILQLTDQHYCESEDKDEKTLELTRKLLGWAQPDLVVFSGDAVSGDAGGSQNPGFFQTCWEKFTGPVMDAGYPYAYILGNHDDQGDLNREEIVQLDQTNPFSIRSSCEGIPNKAVFYVPIFSSNDTKTLAANIWLFDSGSYGCLGYENTYGCIEEDQLEWYDQVSQQLKDQYGTNVHHIAFYHIATPEYLQVYNYEEIYGISGEGIGCSVINTGFFSHVLKNKDISATFIGHDHNNDFGGYYGGVELVYGRKSGYGSYGTLRGARVIKLKETVNEEGQLTVTRDHFVYYEDGTIGYTTPVKKRVGLIQDQCNALYTPLYWKVLRYIYGGIRFGCSFVMSLFGI